MKQRTCIACRKKQDKEELLRIVAINGEATLDKTQKENTRGMYICNNSSCIEKLLKAKDTKKCIKIHTTDISFKELLKNLGE